MESGDTLAVARTGTFGWRLEPPERITFRPFERSKGPLDGLSMLKKIADRIGKVNPFTALGDGGAGG